MSRADGSTKYAMSKNLSTKKTNKDIGEEEEEEEEGGKLKNSIGPETGMRKLMTEGTKETREQKIIQDRSWKKKRF